MNIRAMVIMVFALLASLVGGDNLRAQLAAELQSQGTTDDLSVMLEAIEATTPAPASSVPLNGLAGTYFSAQYPSWPPLP
jgi:hypothetical protein